MMSFPVISTLQLIGNALLGVASKDTNLVACGEALDALLDVFADGQEAEQAARNINLLAALKALQPAFTAKVRTHTHTLKLRFCWVILLSRSKNFKHHITVL